MEKGLKISLFGPHVTMAIAAPSQHPESTILVTVGLVRLPVGKFLDIEILLGKRNLDLVFIEFLVDLLVQRVQDTTAEHWLLDPAQQLELQTR